MTLEAFAIALLLLSGLLVGCALLVERWMKRKPVNRRRKLGNPNPAAIAGESWKAYTPGNTRYGNG